MSFHKIHRRPKDPCRADNEFSQNTSETELSTQGRSIGGNTHQPKPGSQAGGWAIRRGEGGGGGGGWALRVARGGEAIVFLQGGSQGNRTRATLKAHPPFIHPRPYGVPNTVS